MIIETLKTILEEDTETGGVFDAVADRVYPLTLPDAPTYPAIVLTKIFGQPQYDLQGEAGVDQNRVQVDIHATSASQAIDLKKRVRRLLSGYRGGPTSGEPCQIQGIFCINDFDLTEPVTERTGPRVRRRVLEFNIHSREV